MGCVKRTNTFELVQNAHSGHPAHAQTVKTLIRLRKCAGCAGPSLSTYARRHIFVRRGPHDPFVYLIHLLLMTDSICHSSLPRTVLETVTLTTIKFRIYPRTKVDPMFTVCILVRH